MADNLRIFGTTYTNVTGIKVKNTNNHMLVYTKYIDLDEDYITDGLIAYWDAIDNTRSGHNSSATTWENLVGGGTYDLTKTGSASSWSQNSLVLTGASENGYYGDTVWAVPTASTIELVLKPTSTATQCVLTLDRDATMYSNPYYNSRRFAIYSDNTVGFVGKSGKTYTNSVSSLTSIRKMVATYEGFTVANAYVNNTALSLSSKTHSFGYVGNSQYRVGGENLGSEDIYMYSGEIYAIRVYNRVLTSEEITKNFNYDNERFSLGL